MPLPVLIFLVVFALAVLALVRAAKRAGPRQLPETDLQRATAVRKATSANPGSGWDELGSETTAKGLDIRFDHDDDPQAEATFLAAAAPERGNGALANRVTIRLPSQFQTFHVHTGGYVFRVRARGTGPVVGKEIRLQMHVHGDGRPHCGRIENDDGDDAAVGGWIEFESLEILQLRRD